MGRNETNPGYSKLQWENMTSYIEEISTHCLSPASLLKDTYVEPEDVDVFTLDSWGHSVEILGRFLEMPSFEPEYLVFESDPASNVWALENASAAEEYLRHTLDPLLRMLEARGYVHSSVGHETVAVHSTLIHRSLQLSKK